MTALKTKHADCIAVCDGGKALILENIGDDRFPSLRVRECRTSDLPRTSAVGRDAPGRVHQSASPARSAVEGSDTHQRGEDRFLSSIVEDLNRAAEDGQFEKIIIVAPPHVLGVMRPHYSKTLRGLIRAELAKDLAHRSVSDIEQQLFG
jgi:protein required for attachment to host cells